MAEFKDHFTQHVGMSFARQLALADFLGNVHWEVDFGSGMISFGKAGKFPVQIIGSESDREGTWMWAWANDALTNDIGSELLRDATHMREYGQDNDITALTDATFLRSRALDGHQLAQLAVGVCGASCYYRGPYDGGAGFFLLYDVPLAVDALPLKRISKVIMQIISTYDVAHQPMIEAYLTQQGFSIAKSAQSWQVSHADGRAAEVVFDHLGKLVTMNFVEVGR